MERCKYLEESKCVGICTNTCKFPTQVNDSSKYSLSFFHVTITATKYCACLEVLAFSG